MSSAAECQEAEQLGLLVDAEANTRQAGPYTVTAKHWQAEGAGTGQHMLSEATGVY